MPIFTSLSCRTRAFESLPFATWRSKHILVFKTFLETPRIRFKIFTKTTPLIYFLAGTEAQKFWLSRENFLPFLCTAPPPTPPPKGEKRKGSFWFASLLRNLPKTLYNFPYDR